MMGYLHGYIYLSSYWYFIINVIKLRILVLNPMYITSIYNPTNIKGNLYKKKCNIFTLTSFLYLYTMLH